MLHFQNLQPLPIIAMLILQAPAIPDKITDQGLLLAAFILLLSFLAVMGIIALVGKYALPPLLAKLAGNGHKAQAEALAALQAEVKLNSELVKSLDANLRSDYHDRLVPSTERVTLALLKLRLVDEREVAEADERRIADIEAKDDSPTDPRRIRR